MCRLLYLYNLLLHQHDVLRVSAAHAGALSREQLLDRFHQHTQHCTSCRNAHTTATRVQALAKAVAQVFLAAAIGVLAAAGKPLVAAALGLAAAAAAGVSAAAAKLVQQLVFVDYDHHHVSKQ